MQYLKKNQRRAYRRTGARRTCFEEAIMPIRIVRKTAMMFLVLAAVGFLGWTGSRNLAPPGPKPPRPLLLWSSMTIRRRSPERRPIGDFRVSSGGRKRPSCWTWGGRSELLFQNLEALKVDPKEVQVIALSHAHLDHTGALVPFLIRKRGRRRSMRPSIGRSNISRARPFARPSRSARTFI